MERTKKKSRTRKKVEGYEGAGGGIGMDDKAQDWKGGEEEESEQKCGREGKKGATELNKEGI